ncbi:MAG TPA: ATP-binding protein [Blastocatellia bacterium]|nr:ATP-binding protein [Blastocatellia bacterium]
MPLIEILKLVGFAMGAALYLYIAWLIWHRRLGSRKALTQTERTFITLGLCMGAWFLGNLFTVLHLLVLRDRLTGLLRVWDTMTMVGIALFPAALLHAHVAFWSSIDNYRFLKPRHVRLSAILIYLPMVGLPFALYLLFKGEYQPFLFKLRPLLIPYSVWFVFAVWSSAAIDWAMKDRFENWAERERRFFKRLALLLFMIGALEFLVVVILKSGPNDAPWVAYVLLSLLPPFAVAYHVYRYKLVELAIKDSLVYAAFAVVFIAVYTYGVRRIDQFLVRQLGSEPGVVEVLLILGMVALTGPFVRLIDRGVHRIFVREIGLYRDVVRQVSTSAAGFGELDSLVRYTEETIRQGLDLTRVEIVPYGPELESGPMRRLAQKMIDWETDVVETDEELDRLEAAIAYALRREGKLVGIMIISAPPRSLTSEKRAILDVLAGQVAVEVESVRLIEEKVRLERELASRERLATLGQMATTVAHEVKNPLSSIKSIAQVMREEAALSDYDRDLGLIVSEIDRLNRTVSQLLAFSRPSNADARPVALRDLIDSTMALLGNEARERGVALTAEIKSDVTLTGAQAAALREALSNLVVNAIQANEREGRVEVEAAVEASKKLIILVTDTGPGISAEAQRRVFEPFYTTKARGTGLGLAIVQRRVAEMNGTLDLTSPVIEGHGTRFRLIVPVAAVNQEVK